MGVQLLTELNAQPLELMEDWFVSNNQLIKSILSGAAPFSFAQAKLPPHQMLAGNTYGNNQVVTIRDYYNAWGEPKQLPQNSIFQISVEGPIFRAAACANGTIDYAAWLNRAAADPNVIGAIVGINSPGGVVYGTNLFTAAMEAFKATGKPLVTYTNDGMACSAGYKIFSHGQYALLSNKHDMVGSIGTMMVVHDITGQLKKEGIIEHIIYAPQSTDKNQDYHKAQKGDYSGILKTLETLAGDFIATVQANRPGVSADALTGKTFIGSQAIEMGLADDIANINEIVQAVADMAAPAPKRKSVSSTPSATNSLEMFDKYPALTALAGVESPTEEQLLAANANLEAKGLGNINVIGAGQLQQLLQTSVQAAQAENKVQELTATTTSLQEQIAELTAANQALTARNAEVEAYAASAGDQITAVTTNTPDAETKGEDKPLIVNDLASDPFSQSILKKFK